uniref:Uncharacterized protein n=1 Tax=Scylla olivacea TaxID=85551 RepID=A0A0P4W9L5_SCYOL
MASVCGGKRRGLGNQRVVRETAPHQRDAHERPVKSPACVRSCNKRVRGGMRINLETNFFPILASKKDIKVMVYEVEFHSFGNKPIYSRKQKLEIFELMKKAHPRVFDSHPVAFDSDKKAYGVGVISDVGNSEQQSASYVVSKMNENCHEKWRVTMALKEELHLGDLLEVLYSTPGQHSFPPKIIQFLEVMFHHSRALKYKLVGHRHFYSFDRESGTAYPIGSNKEGAIGFFDSVRPSSWRNGSLLLNIDVSHAAFYKEQSLLDFVNGVMSLQESDLHRTLDPHRKRRLIQEIKDLKVCATFSNVSRTYKIISITERGANRQTFPRKDEKTGVTENITVVDYFRHVHGKSLYFPNFNCVQVAPSEKNIFLPMEFCRIASAQKVKKLADQEIAQFLKIAAVAPAERRRQICKLYDQNNFSEDSVLKSLGFTIEKNPLRIAGRVLPPPLLHMNHVVEPHDGVWDVRGCRFFQGALIRSWVVFNYNTERVNLSHIRIFTEQLLRLGKEYGMELNDPMTIQDMPRAHIEEHLIYFKRKYPDLQLIMVVLDKNDELYGRLKKIGDVDIGIITQCLQASTVRLCKESTMLGVLLKINAKMGGINTIIANPSSPQIFSHSVMIMGADVNHPSAGDGVSPSVAACVASLDRHASMYAVEVMPQDHRVEIILDLKKMVKNLIMSHGKVQRRWPDKIVMYRDGVSESEFITVLLHEVKAMRQACAELSQDYKPGITFLIVQKRHHTRFFCHRDEGVGRCRNIPPGTVVDTGITHPSERDFYLCSHQGIQGTTRPTHYHVLWDDNNMTLDELETLTYSMCHLYSRCNKSVSLPTPAYYAHLAAFRAKVHISDLFDHYDGSEGVTKEDIMNAARMDHSHPMAYTMYYL